MIFIELLKVILLGIVEGITEWLPISSTGHMILVDEFYQAECIRGIYGIFPGGDPAWRNPGSCCTVLEQAVAFLHKKKSRRKHRWHCVNSRQYPELSLLL